MMAFSTKVGVTSRRHCLVFNLVTVELVRPIKKSQKFASSSYDNMSVESTCHWQNVNFNLLLSRRIYSWVYKLVEPLNQFHPNCRAICLQLGRFVTGSVFTLWHLHSRNKWGSMYLLFISKNRPQDTLVTKIICFQPTILLFYIYLSWGKK